MRGAMEINGLKISLRPMIFVDQMTPKGFLTKDDACHACWYYYILAENGRAAWAGGPENQILEHDATGVIDATSPEWPLWMDRHYGQQARSVAFLYALDSPERMWKFWPNVSMEARRLNMPVPRDEYKNPPVKDRIT